MSRIPDGWERLLAQRPVPLVDYLLTEIAQLLAKDLGTWPPPIGELDSRVGDRFRPIASGERARPPDQLYEEGFRLARWELLRDFEACDDYMRNQRWMQRGLASSHKLELLFLSRWIVERLLSVREETQSRISRRQLVDCLDLAQRRFQQL